MESEEALYTILCSSLILSDQYPDSANLSGSGLPIPLNGSFSISGEFHFKVHHEQLCKRIHEASDNVGISLVYNLTF